ncbi:hypothetical protein D3C78_1495590 [compost metagenome]
MVVNEPSAVALASERSRAVARSASASPAYSPSSACRSRLLPSWVSDWLWLVSDPSAAVTRVVRLPMAVAWPAFSPSAAVTRLSRAVRALP